MSTPSRPKSANAFSKAPLTAHLDAAVILAGGQGARLWPISTAARPKPYVPLTPSGETLIELTVRRLQPLLARSTELRVVVGSALAPLTRAVLGDRVGVWIEPASRNTALSVAFGVRSLLNSGVPSESVVGFFPADHLVLNETHYQAAIGAGAAWARTHAEVVLLGTEARSPSTRYGYLELGSRAEFGPEPQVVSARRFVEKPDAAWATRAIADGGVLWNCGVFLGQLAAFERAFVECAPEVWRWADPKREAASVETSVAPDRFRSFDYEVSERLAQFGAIVSRVDRVDVGNLESVFGMQTADAQGNRVYGQAELVDSSNNWVFAEGKPVKLVGVHEHVVIASGEAIVVCPRDVLARTQSLRDARGRS